MLSAFCAQRKCRGRRPRRPATCKFGMRNECIVVSDQRSDFAPYFLICHCETRPQTGCGNPSVAYFENDILWQMT